MCDTCGCEQTGATPKPVEPQRIPVVQKILSANDQAALENREHLKSHGITAFNLMSSPGAGKTTLLLATIAALREKTRVGVIEGDSIPFNNAHAGLLTQLLKGIPLRR